MAQAGFVEIEALYLVLPLSGWSTSASICFPDSYEKVASKGCADPRDHDIGVANQPSAYLLLENLAVYPFTRNLRSVN
jgi:hypothetical protein